MVRLNDRLATRTMATAVTAVLLATAMLITTAGVGRAEPPQPTAEIRTFSCDNGPSGFVNWKLTADLANKGRWVDLEWSVTADSGTPDSGTDRYDSRGLDYANRGVIVLAADTTVNATASIAVLDKKGVAASDTVTVTCAP